MDGKTRGRCSGTAPFAAHRPAMDRAGYRRMVEAERATAEEVTARRTATKLGGKGRPADSSRPPGPSIKRDGTRELSRLRRELARCMAVGSRQSYAKRMAILDRTAEVLQARAQRSGLTALSA